MVSPDSVILTGTINKKFAGDSALLIVHGQFYLQTAPLQFAQNTLKAAIGSDGEFAFKIGSPNSPFHISVAFPDDFDKSGELKNPLHIANYLVEPGNNIQIRQKNDSLFFSGTGAALFDTQYRLQRLTQNQIKGDTLFGYNENPQRWLQIQDAHLDEIIGTLEKSKVLLSPLSYRIIKADYVGDNRQWVFEIMQFTGFNHRTPTGKNNKIVFEDLRNRTDLISKDSLEALSPKYVYFLYTRLVTQGMYAWAEQHDGANGLDVNLFGVMKNGYDGLVRDKLLYFWLYKRRANNELRPFYIDSALSIVKTPYFRDLIINENKAFEKGKPVIDFDFSDKKDKSWNLNDFKGKVVLLDLWFSGCSGCVAVAKGLPNVEHALKGRSDIAFVSLSIDKNRSQWLQSVSKNPTGQHYTHYTTPSTIYLYTNGSGTNNKFIKTYVPANGYPQLLIIDKDGAIYNTNPSKPWDRPGEENLIAELREALNK
ncbi:hypothetical protein RG47T_1152 [Mucilaginibacter polytrichastri]|uniref:Thioredoxin domain-containing protein n=1 Tax=Mucilaginibacter polytrichastri TaxID=1302689 RepID=A0A1Q5ZVE6_9SPHI|nr:hypothetical protein RG47T_1152 [Mucilaginibacter polytrichastri]